MLFCNSTMYLRKAGVCLSMDGLKCLHGLSSSSRITNSSFSELKVIRHFNTTSAKSTVDFVLTEDNILSDENKKRCQLQMINLVHPKPGRKLKKAAVLVPLCYVKGEPSLLYTLRSSSLNSHRGQVSFPGGKHDLDDRDLEHTAVREAVEEIGLSEDDIDIWGMLRRWVPSSDYQTAVTPVLANCGEIDVSSLKINHDEVAKVFTCTLKSLCDPHSIRYTHFARKPPYSLPVYTGGELRIWGLTAIITHLCLTVLAGNLYQFKIKLIR